MKKRTPYDFSGYDPIIDRVVSLLDLAQVRSIEISRTSGVSIATIYQLRRTSHDRGMVKYHSKGIKFATLARIVYGLGHNLADLEQERKARNAHQLKVLTGRRAS